MIHHTVYLSLGSNLGDSRETLQKACATIKALPAITLMQASPIYVTNPQLVTDQPDFVNQVIQIECDATWTPECLWQALSEIETRLGRVRDTVQRFGHRNIDIDILLFNMCQYKIETLTLPHPRMHDRAFVLVPLADIAPDLALRHADIGIEPEIDAGAETGADTASFITVKALLSKLSYSLVGERLKQTF